MTSQIRWHIEYLIRTHNILLLNIILKTDEKCGHTGDLMIMIVAYFLGHPVFGRDFWISDLFVIKRMVINDDDALRP